MTSLWRFLFQFNVVLLVMLAFSMLFVEPGSSGFVIGVLSAIVIGISLLGTGIFIYFDIDPLTHLE